MYRGVVFIDVQRVEHHRFVLCFNSGWRGWCLTSCSRNRDWFREVFHSYYVSCCVAKFQGHHLSFNGTGTLVPAERVVFRTNSLK